MTEPLRLLQVGRSDLMGARFNGFALRHKLRDRAIHTRFLAFSPVSQHPDVVRAFPYPGRDWLTAAAGRVERARGLHAVAQLHSFALPLHKSFRTAHVVHYHVIHDGFFSILAMPWLARLKPSVWTWHDPWIMTGHCVHPISCERWRKGCGTCPDLARPFPVDFDNTARGFAIKRWTVEHTPIDIVVASAWMERMAAASPIGRRARLHRIPFGINLTRFRPRHPGPARARLGVRPGHVVIAARGSDSVLKGAGELAAALERIATPITVLLLQDAGRFDHLIGRHQIISLDWSDDEAALAEAYSAADMFVMPSAAESFGLMAIEAMACGRPVIVFDGTALPETTFAPEIGVAVPAGDVEALARAIVRLAADPAERAQRGIAGRAAAVRHYGETLFADRMASLYRDVQRRRAWGVEAQLQATRMAGAT